MQKDHKVGPKSIHWKAGQRPSELNFSRTPVVISSSSFKRYDLEQPEVPDNSISLASIANIGRFIGLKFSNRRRAQL